MKSEPSTVTVFIIATIVGALMLGLFGCQSPSVGYL